MSFNNTQTFCSIRIFLLYCFSGEDETSTFEDKTYVYPKPVLMEPAKKLSANAITVSTLYYIVTICQSSDTVFQYLISFLSKPI